jgi:hypothetical protein
MLDLLTRRVGRLKLADREGAIWRISDAYVGCSAVAAASRRHRGTHLDLDVKTTVHAMFAGLEAGPVHSG